MNLIVTSSPHIRGKETTSRIMLDVLLALMPALLVGICFQGLGPWPLPWSPWPPVWQENS